MYNGSNEFVIDVLNTNDSSESYEIRIRGSQNILKVKE